MAYGLKYELLCVTRKRNLYKVKILFDGYTGAQIDRNIPTDKPFLLRKDKATVIRGTSFEYKIREEVDFEFLEFYTNKKKFVKVELYDPSNNLIWIGYNLPQQYQVPYVPSPVNVSFTATDGLGLLKNEPFTLTGFISLLEILIHCVDKIDLGLSYSIAITLFAENHNHYRSPLAQTYIYSDLVFAGLNCYEVIEKILTPFNSEITQSCGRWAITRMADKKSTRMLYTSAGVYISTESAPTVLNIGQKGETGVTVTPRGKLNFSIEAGAKQVKITHNYGRKNSFVYNSDFSRYESSVFPGWAVDGSFTPVQRFNSNGSYLLIPGRSNTEEFITASMNVEAASAEDFVFSLKMGALGSKLYGGIPISVLMAMTIGITLTDGDTTMYLTEEGWTDIESWITKKVLSKIGGEPQFNLLEIPPYKLPFSGILVIYLGRYHSMHEINDSSWTIPGVVYSDINCYSVLDNELYPAGFSTLADFVNSSEPSDLPDIELAIGDAPDSPNSSLIFKNIWYYENGTPI